MNQLLTNWKSTAIGTAVLTLALMQSVKFDAAGHLAMTQRDWFVAAIGILGQVIGFMQKDAGVVLATTPANPDPHVEPSHEIADNPKATAVKEPK